MAEIIFRNPRVTISLNFMGSLVLRDRDSRESALFRSWLGEWDDCVEGIAALRELIKTGRTGESQINDVHVMLSSDQNMLVATDLTDNETVVVKGDAYLALLLWLSNYETT